MRKKNGPSWQRRVPDNMQGLVERFDAELDHVMGIAAYAGDAGLDQTPVSYSSLMIAFLWSDDPTSLWLQAFIDSHNISTRRILQHRGLKPDMREGILKRAEQDGKFRPGMQDFFSSSAGTMLRNAEAIANETAVSGPLCVRHLMAAYAFRNPPFHDKDLQSWGFDPDALRHEYSLFLAKQYPEELDAWIEILRGYLPEDFAPPEESHPGRILGSYQLDAETLTKLRLTEALSAIRSVDTMNSEQFLAILLATVPEPRKDQPDCDDLKRFVYADAAVKQRLDSRLDPGSGLRTTGLDKTFADEATGLQVSRGLKRILDRARTIAISTTDTAALGIRHLIASILVNPDSTALSVLTESGVAMTELRRELLHRFTRRWMTDDGSAWRLVLVGSTPPTLSGFDTDNPEKGDDRLDVTRYATAFATVMAAETIEPPLSIGIFGDWGSGKSFFMRLMREQTKEVSRLSDVDADGERLFCRRVVAIKFNAWHYAETNLWASLVQTILSALDEAIRKKDGDVMDRLCLVQAAREEAEQHLQRIKKKRAAADGKLKTIRKVRNKRNRELSDLKGRDVIAAFSKEFLSDDEVKAAMKAAEDDLGIQGAKTAECNVGALMEVVEQAHEQSIEIRSSWDWLQQPHIRDHLIRVGISVTAISSVLLLALYRIDAVTNTLNALLGELGLVTGAILLRARPLLKGVRCGLDRMSNLRSRLNTMQAERMGEHESEFVQAQTVLKAADNEVTQAQQALAEADAEVIQAEQEVKESTSTRRIATLIERRLAGRDYAKYLGIIAAIREDFQTLSECLAQRDTEDPQDDPEYEPIDRIVLYIDDLDRCPSDKVVSVLEAVHLMLAFPLFVVVVGVDIRWAGTSLHDHYPKHLDSGLQDGTSNPDQLTEGRGASALDYLEKIFQIPFWLPPMEEEASRNMIAAMVPVTAPVSETKELDKTSEGSTITPTGVEVEGVEEATHAETQPKEPTEAGGAESLFIAPHEREYMLRLAGAVGKSPRRLKRFVNTYRILKASCDALERDKFVLDDGKGGTYRAAMTLLAITTGAPRAAIAILHELNELEENAALKDFELRIGGLVTTHDKTETDYAREALQVYRTAYTGTEPGLRDLRYWAAPAARFSFRSGRI